MCNISICPLHATCKIKASKEICTRYRAYQDRDNPDFKGIIGLFFPDLIPKGQRTPSEEQMALTELIIS